MPKTFYEEISPELTNIIRAIQPIGGRHDQDAIRRYIDCQITLVHQKARKIGTESILIEARENYKEAGYDFEEAKQ